MPLALLSTETEVCAGPRRAKFRYYPSVVGHQHHFAAPDIPEEFGELVPELPHASSLHW
jgi:hypothetical protein